MCRARGSGAVRCARRSAGKKGEEDRKREERGKGERNGWLVVSLGFGALRLKSALRRAAVACALGITKPEGEERWIGPARPGARQGQRQRRRRAPLKGGSGLASRSVFPGAQAGKGRGEGEGGLCLHVCVGGGRLTTGASSRRRRKRERSCSCGRAEHQPMAAADEPGRQARAQRRGRDAKERKYVYACVCVWREARERIRAETAEKARGQREKRRRLQLSHPAIAPRSHPASFVPPWRPWRPAAAAHATSTAHPNTSTLLPDVDSLSLDSLSRIARGVASRPPELVPRPPWLPAPGGGAARLQRVQRPPAGPAVRRAPPSDARVRREGGGRRAA